jgi:hypothetical protein
MGDRAAEARQAEAEDRGKNPAVLPLRAAACAGEPHGSCMARIVDKYRCPGNILPAKSRDFE